MVKSIVCTTVGAFVSMNTRNELVSISGLININQVDFELEREELDTNQ